jgi:hypothetical protein
MTDPRPIVTPPLDPTGTLEPVAERQGRRPRDGGQRRPRAQAPPAETPDDEVVIAPTGDRVDVRA